MSLKSGRPSKRTPKHIEKPKQTIVDDEKEKRLNVRMKESEYRQLKQFALDNDMSISEIVKDAIYKYVS